MNHVKLKSWNNLASTDLGQGTILNAIWFYIYNLQMITSDYSYKIP